MRNRRFLRWRGRWVAVGRERRHRPHGSFGLDLRGYNSSVHAMEALGQWADRQFGNWKYEFTVVPFVTTSERIDAELDAKLASFNDPAKVLAAVADCRTPTEAMKMAFKLGDLAPQDMPMRRSCWRKQAHDTREHAEAQMVSMIERRVTNNPSALEAYLCDYCHKWHVGHNRTKERDMSDLREAMKSGGLLAVFLGHGYELPADLAFHPQVRAIEANTLTPQKVNIELANNVRAAVLTDHIDYRIYLTLQGELKRRKLVFALRKDRTSLEATLREIFDHRFELDAAAKEQTEAAAVLAVVTAATTTTTKPASENGGARPTPAVEAGRQVAPKGAITALIEEFWDNIKDQKAAEAARWLSKKAEERKIPTTLNSLEQQIRTVRRRHDAESRPETEMTEVLKTLDDTMESLGALQKAIEALPQAIAGLELVREYVASAERRAADHERKNEDMVRKQREMEETVNQIKDAFARYQTLQSS